MTTNKLNRRQALALAALPTLTLRPAHGAPRSCYRAVGSPLGKPAGLTLALIDTTTIADTQVVASFSSLVAKSLRKPGERLLVASFAGLAPGQFPAVKADVLHEPAPSAELVESNVLDWTARLRACLGKLGQVNAGQIATALKGSIAAEPAAPYSEIVAGVRWAMLDLLPKLQPLAGQVPIKLIVYSDGEQNSRAGTSFYRNGAPREISAAVELRAIERPDAGDGTRTLSPIDVWWVGIGLQPPGVKIYMTPRALDERRRFWSGVLAAFGARRISLGLTLPDDGL